MPELPEIETIRTALEAQILAKKIQRTVLRRPDLRHVIPKDLPERIKLSPVCALRRRSKYLLIDFRNGETLIIHLGMSGRLYFAEKERDYDAHDHVLFDFEDGKHLRLRDPRRFGLLEICKTSELDQHKLFLHLGEEPLNEEFTPETLYQFAKKSDSPIKLILMNAKNVVGVGNIYANEALFFSGVRPTRRGVKITVDEADRLCHNIKKVLRESIAQGGTSFRDYVSTNEEPGFHQLHLSVYGRENEPCRVCGRLIKRVIQSNRSSFYCPQCQS